MRQAQTLNEAQFRRILHYCRSRRHPVRDTTIFMVSFYAALRAKEIASLKLGDVFDETGAVREQFISGADQSKGGQRRTVSLNQHLRKALANYAKSKCLRELNRPLLESQKGGHFSANTMCQLFLDIYWTCPAYVLVSELTYAAFRSNAKGLLSPSDEWRRRGL